jgi:hypothetical protein
LKRLSLAVLLTLAIAGCTERPAADSENKAGGFYGGVSGGMSRP